MVVARDPVDVEEAIASLFPCFAIRRVEWNASEAGSGPAGLLVVATLDSDSSESSAQPPPWLRKSGQTPLNNYCPLLLIGDGGN